MRHLRDLIGSAALCGDVELGGRIAPGWAIFRQWIAKRRLRRILTLIVKLHCVGEQTRLIHRKDANNVVASQRLVFHATQHRDRGKGDQGPEQSAGILA